MDASSRRLKGRDGAFSESSLNSAIETLNLAKEISGVAPAKAAFGTVSTLLTTIRDSIIGDQDYVELGLDCADVCRTLDRGMRGKKLDDASQSVCEAIGQLTTTVAEIQGEVTKRRERLAQAGKDKGMVAVWKSDLNRVLQIFTTDLAMDTQKIVSGIHHDAPEGIGGQVRSTQTRSAISTTNEPGLPPAPKIPGESPPPPPMACFGCDELVEKVIGLAEHLTPIALIGPGGIGKTSIALTVLHHDRIKERFGNDRWFIRCDQFPASHTHFLSRLSKATGAGVEDPEDLTALRPFLSSREMIIFLDNVESILGPQGSSARESYAMVEELSRFNNLCLCITSRTPTFPPTFKALDIPTLLMEAAHDTFYRISGGGGRSDLIDNILKQLDFHPLSITLLASAAHHNKWDTDQLTGEWEKQQTDVVRSRRDGGLAATIELSLASPSLHELGSDVRGVLGVIAFFPQGVNENNLAWLFPTLPDRTTIFDDFCALSLTHRSNGFITMLAPLRDYFYPEELASSLLLNITKDCYFRRLSVDVNPGRPGFEEGRWITTEDVNVEHLLDVFASVDVISVSVWDACAKFIEHLYWHKPRLVALGPKIERLPDDHPSKPQCLSELARLFNSVGNYIEHKRLLTRTLELSREQGNDLQVAQTLRFLSNANRQLDLYEEGIQQTKEALEISVRVKDASGQAHGLKQLAWLLYDDGQPDAAEEAAARAIDLLLDDGEQFPVCECHRVLGLICHSMGKTEEAINHLRTALEIASPFNWNGELFWIHHSLVEFSVGEARFDDAHAYVRRIEPHTINDPYLLGRATELLSRVWYKEDKFEEARTEALRAAEIFEKIGAAKDLEDCRYILRKIEKVTRVAPGSPRSDSDDSSVDE